MIHVPTLIEAASRVMTLGTGDILCTGTPQGVSRVLPGQVMRAGIKGYESSDVKFGVVSSNSSANNIFNGIFFLATVN